MPHWNYIIVGGGMAAAAAAEALRHHDAAGTVAILTAEPHPPYRRPPLSLQVVGL